MLTTSYSSGIQELQREGKILCVGESEFDKSSHVRDSRTGLGGLSDFNVHNLPEDAQRIIAIQARQSFSPLQILGCGVGAGMEMQNARDSAERETAAKVVIHTVGHTPVNALLRFEMTWMEIRSQFENLFSTMPSGHRGSYTPTLDPEELLKNAAEMGCKVFSQLPSDHPIIDKQYVGEFRRAIQETLDHGYHFIFDHCGALYNSMKPVTGSNRKQAASLAVSRLAENGVLYMTQANHGMVRAFAEDNHRDHAVVALASDEDYGPCLVTPKGSSFAERLQQDGILLYSQLQFVPDLSDRLKAMQ